LLAFGVCCLLLASTDVHCHYQLNSVHPSITLWILWYKYLVTAEAKGKRPPDTPSEGSPERLGGSALRESRPWKVRTRFHSKTTTINTNSSFCNRLSGIVVSTCPAKQQPHRYMPNAVPTRPHPLIAASIDQALSWSSCHNSTSDSSDYVCVVGMPWVPRICL